MADAAADELRRELGKAASTLPPLKTVSAKDRQRLAATIRAAKQVQRKALADSTERALQHVPALLRGVVRRVLGA